MSRAQFFLQLERNGLHISAKFRERIPNRGSQGADQIFQFFGNAVVSLPGRMVAGVVQSLQSKSEH